MTNERRWTPGRAIEVAEAMEELRAPWNHLSEAPAPVVEAHAILADALMESRIDDEVQRILDQVADGSLLGKQDDGANAIT